MSEDKPKFFMGACNSLMCDRHIEGLTHELPAETANFYGGAYCVGESITKCAAKKIAKALGGEWID